MYTKPTAPPCARASAAAAPATSLVPGLSTTTYVLVGTGCAAADPAEPIAVTSAATTRAVPVLDIGSPLARLPRMTIPLFVTTYHEAASRGVRPTART